VIAKKSMIRACGAASRGVGSAEDDQLLDRRHTGGGAARSVSWRL